MRSEDARNSVPVDEAQKYPNVSFSEYELPIEVIGATVAKNVYGERSIEGTLKDDD